MNLRAPSGGRLLCARLASSVRNLLDRRRDPAAASFFSDLSRGYDPDAHIDVVASRKLIYVCVPKCASTTVKMILSALAGRKPASPRDLHKRRYSGLLSPQQVGVSAFHRIATDPAALRFSFVRNPYQRLVSAWADKFQDRPLVAGNPFIDSYLAIRAEIDASLPHGEDRVLSFADFVAYATATAHLRVDPHWQLQDDIVSMPRLALDLIGKVETFARDIGRVLDHAGAPESIRKGALSHLNASRHRSWEDYYTGRLANRVYRAYERDFDRFGYPRALPKSPGALSDGSCRSAQAAVLPVA